MDNNSYAVQADFKRNKTWKLHLEAMLHKGVTLSLDAYPEMIRLHEKIHSLAHKIADFYHEGHQEQATSLMEEFKKTSRELFQSLDELYTS